MTRNTNPFTNEAQNHPPCVWPQWESAVNRKMERQSAGNGGAPKTFVQAEDRPIRQNQEAQVPALGSGVSAMDTRIEMLIGISAVLEQKA